MNFLLSAINEEAANLSILDALVVSIIGFAIVFVVLIVLMLIIQLMGVISKNSQAITSKLPKIDLSKFKKKKDNVEVAPVVEKVEEEKAIGTCGELVLVNTEERDAAMIMAIVADNLGTPLNELRFKSIKRVDVEDKK